MDVGRGWFTSGSDAQHYLEPLELLLPLHGHGWRGGVSVALHHLAPVRLHWCGVVVATVDGCDGRPMAARALRHGRHLARKENITYSYSFAATSARCVGREKSAFPDPGIQVKF